MSGLIIIILSIIGHENSCKDNLMESAQNLLDGLLSGKNKISTLNVYLWIKDISLNRYRTHSLSSPHEIKV